MIDSGQENRFKLSWMTCFLYLLLLLFFSRKGYMNFYIHVTRDHKSGYSPNTFVEASGHQLQQRMEIVSTGLRNSLLLSPLRLEEARGLLRFETCSGSVT